MTLVCLRLLDDHADQMREVAHCAPATTSLHPGSTHCHSDAADRIVLKANRANGATARRHHRETGLKVCGFIRGCSEFVFRWGQTLKAHLPDRRAATKGIGEFAAR